MVPLSTGRRRHSHHPEAEIPPPRPASEVEAKGPRSRPAPPDSAPWWLEGAEGSDTPPRGGLELGGTAPRGGMWGEMGGSGVMERVGVVGGDLGGG